MRQQAKTGGARKWRESGFFFLVLSHFPPPQATAGEMPKRLLDEPLQGKSECLSMNKVTKLTLSQERPRNLD
jgi:hypothetical protein